MIRWLPRVGIALVALGGLLLVLLAAVYGVSAQRLSRPVDIPVRDTVAIPSDSASIARGSHLVVAITGCMGCHAADLGGARVVDAGPLFGRVYAPNLTRGTGGIGGAFTTADWERALRHGVAPDGRALMIMPADALGYLSDEDLGDIVAYVRRVPPVNRAPERSSLGPLARALLVMGKLPLLPARHIDQNMPHPKSVASGATRDYGAYLVHIAGCAGCHGENLAGGPVVGAPPDVPPAQNLTPTGLGTWSVADFTRAMRTGQRPDGTTINPYMPWSTFRNMTDEELQAIWLYLQHVPPSPGSSR